MRNFTILSALFIFFLATSCASSGANSQTWAPKNGKPMKRGMNNNH